MTLRPNKRNQTMQALSKQRVDRGQVVLVHQMCEASRIHICLLGRYVEDTVTGLQRGVEVAKDDEHVPVRDVADDGRQNLIEGVRLFKQFRCGCGCVDRHDCCLQMRLALLGRDLCDYDMVRHHLDPSKCLVRPWR